VRTYIAFVTDETDSSLWRSAQRRLKLRRRITIALVVALIACGLAMGLPVVLSPPRSVVIAPRGTQVPTATSSAEIDAIGRISGASFVVHVVGAVATPGLIVVSSGSRVIDAVLLAGGLLASADQCGINLARVVTDGEQLVIPSRAGPVVMCSALVSSATAGFAASGKVSLSRATAAELDALPGVGPALAARIIDWRSAHGGFTAVSQLDQVSGIGVKLLAGLKPLVVP
jgi:competence protein ComEA